MRDILQYFEKNCFYPQKNANFMLANKFWKMLGDPANEAIATKI